MVCITFYNSIHWQISVPYQHWSVVDHKRRGVVLNLALRDGKALQYCLFTALPPHEKFMVGGMFWTHFCGVQFPFTGLEDFQGAWFLLHEGMARHFSYYLLLPCHPRYTLVYLYPHSFNAKHLPWEGLSVMALRDGKALAMLSIQCPTTPGLILEY